MKLLLLALLCLAAFSSAQEFDIKNALIYDDPFVVGALWVNVIYDDFMPSTTNPVRPAGSGVMALEYLSAADEVIMTEVTDFFFKYVFQYCDDCSATTVQQEMPIFYHDSTYYTQSIGEQVVNGVTCQGYENPAVVAGTPSLSRRIYIDEATNRPCRHEWSTGKKIDFLTSRQTAGDVTVYPDGSNSINDRSISVLSGQTVLPASANFPWASGCPAPTCKVKIDLMMVLDDSGSVGTTGFNQQVNFFKSLVNSFTISPDDVRVGIVEFASSSALRLSLNGNKNTIINRLDGLSHNRGSTCLGCGMSTARTDVAANGRSDAQCVMVVLTDGRNNVNTGTAFTNVVNAVHNQPCEVFGIGVGSTLQETLDSFVSAPIADHRFLVNDFGALATVLNSVATATCQEIPGGLCGAGCQGLCLCQTDCACPSSCEDFDACTTEQCVAGSNGNGCVYRGRDCALEDQVASGLSSVNLCKIFDCDEDTGCVSVDVDCDDMDPCTVDTCEPSFGCTRSPLICNDNNVCTVDFCDPTKFDANNPNVDVCAYESANCTKCEDQLTMGSLVNCSDARFNPNFADVSLCNPAVCNPESPNEVYDKEFGMEDGDGPCEFRPLNCDDGNPCSVTECVDGVCTVGPLVCDDGNACTIDTCDPNTVGGVDPCVFTPINATIECFDGNPCTQDLCLPESGCDNSQETDCSSLSECAITSCVAALGGCVADTQRCAAESDCFTAECVPENQGGEFDPLVHCVQTEIEGTINSCGECFGNEVACQLEGSKATTIALTVGVIAAIVVAVIVALALGAFGGHQGYKYWQKRNAGNQNWSEDNPIHQTLPSGGNAAAV